MKFITYVAIVVVSLVVIYFPLSAHAADIKCYNGGKLIYHGHGHHFEYTSDFLEFTEDKSKRLVFAFANCIIKLKPAGSGSKPASKHKH